jgi:stearoyl-CoA desaturase (delta-9 desaturase)
MKLNAVKTACDADTLQAVVAHRYAVLAGYARSVKRTCAAELRALHSAAVRVDRGTVTRWLQTDASRLTVPDQARMREVFSNSRILATIFSMRDELTAVWMRSTASKEQLVGQLEDWCRRAEASGIGALAEFSARLRRYELART